MLRKIPGVSAWHFRRVARNSGLRLDYQVNREGRIILEEIFVRRTYAPYFPFYESATIIDIGAHYGYFSFFAALNTKPDSRIIAVEPSLDNLRVLNANLQLNDGLEIELIPLAISEVNGEQPLFGGTSFNHSLVDNQQQATTVETVTLARLFERCGMDRVDFLKMDCEGAEYPVLLNARAETLDRIRVISLEFHDRREAGYRPADLVARLEENGFEVKFFEYSPLSYGGNNNYGRMVALNKSV